MKAVLLAAGKGTRLGNLTNGTPKCMITVGPKKIVDCQLQCLQAMHVHDIVMVVGYMADMLKRYVTEAFPRLRFTFIENPEYATTNTAYSLWLARDAFGDDDFIYCNADVLFHAEIARRLLYSPEKNILAVTRAVTGEEEVKVLLRGSRITAIGKDVPQDSAYGEFIGVGKFSKDIAQLFAAYLAQVVTAQGGKMKFFEAAVQCMVPFVKIAALDVTDLPSIEIDFPEDLHRAGTNIVHKIVRTKQGAAPPKILFYAERNLHLPFLEPIHDYIAETYSAELAFSAPPHMLSQGGLTGCGLSRAEIQRLKAKTRFFENPADFKADIAVVADACFYPVSHCRKIVNVGHGLISKGWFYTDDPVVRRENRADLVCVPGPWHKEILERHVSSPLVVSGFIKADAVAQCSDYDIKKFKEKYGISGVETIILFAPTYNEELSALPCVGERIEELADESTTVLIKLHGMTDKTWVQRYRNLAARSHKVVLIDDADFPAAMRCSKVMISDVSSAAAEYMLLDKPVVFVNNPRRTQYCRYRPADIEYVIRDAGIQVEQFEELKLAVRLACAAPDEYRHKRRSYAERLSLGLDGFSAQRAADAVMRLASSTANNNTACERTSIIVHCSSAATAQQFVTRLRADCEGMNPEIIIIGPRDTTGVIEAAAWVECAELNRKAFLKAVAHAHGDFIAVVHDDMILPKNWFRWMRNYFAWFPDAGAVRALAPHDDYAGILEAIPEQRRPKTLQATAAYFSCALMGNQVRAQHIELRRDCVMLSRRAVESIIGTPSFHTDDGSLDGTTTELKLAGFTIWQALEVFWYRKEQASDIAEDIAVESVPAPTRTEVCGAPDRDEHESEILVRQISEAADLKRSRDFTGAIARLEQAKQLLEGVCGCNAVTDDENPGGIPPTQAAHIPDHESRIARARMYVAEAERHRKSKEYTQAIAVLEDAKACIAAQQGGLSMQEHTIGDLQFEIYQQLGECYAHTGDIEKAREHFEIARSLKPDNPLPLIGLGVAVMQQRCFGEAEGCFRKALELEPNSDRALTGLGLVLQNAGRHAESLDIYQRAMESNPTHLTALMGVVQTAYALGRFDAAEESLRMYLEHYPANVKILYCLAGTYFKQQRYDECRSVLDRIFIFKPDHPEARDLLNMLDEVQGYAYERRHFA